MVEYRDCEYGNYRDMNNDPPCWQDNFFPRNAECDRAREKYNEVVMDILNELAHDFGLDTSEWEHGDYADFVDRVGL